MKIRLIVFDKAKVVNFIEVAKLFGNKCVVSARIGLCLPLLPFQRSIDKGENYTQKSATQVV